MAKEGIQDPAANPKEGTGEPVNNPKKIDLPGWTAGVTNELKEKYGEELSKYQGVSDFVTHSFDLKGRLENAVVKPGDGATPEEVASFRTAMGVPGSADEYKLERLAMPEGMEYDAAREDWFRGVAHKLNLTAEQAAALYAEDQKYEHSSFEEIRKARAQELQEHDERVKKVDSDLHNKYKTDYEPKMKRARLLIKSIGEKAGYEGALDEYLLDSDMGNDPRNIAAWIAVSEMLSDDVFMKGGGGNTTVKKKGTFSFPNTPGMS